MASIPRPIPTKLLPRSNPVLSPSPSLLNRSVLFGDVSGLAARSRRVRYNSKGGVGRKSCSSPSSLVRAVLELEGTAPALKSSGVSRRQRRDDRSKVLGFSWSSFLLSCWMVGIASWWVWPVELSVHGACKTMNQVFVHFESWLTINTAKLHTISANEFVVFLLNFMLLTSSQCNIHNLHRFLEECA